MLSLGLNGSSRLVRERISFKNTKLEPAAGEWSEALYQDSLPQKGAPRSRCDIYFPLGRTFLELIGHHDPSTVVRS